MRTIPRGALLAVVLMGAGPAVVTSSLAMAAEPAVYAGFPSGLAVDGYDPVAYSAEGRPVAGPPALERRYADATWRFASAANTAAFDAEPGKYASSATRRLGKEWLSTGRSRWSPDHYKK